VGDCGGLVTKFHGSYSYSIDNKGRVNIPARFRSILNPAAHETFIICRGPDNSLRAYPNDLWEIYEEELSARPETPETLRHKRLLYNTLTDSTMDSQGRITLSAKQMETAGITKEVTLVGQAKYIEIWDTDRYTKYQQQYEGDFDQMFFQSVDAGIPKR
jgi:MraZ protein